MGGARQHRPDGTECHNHICWVCAVVKCGRATLEYVWRNGNTQYCAASAPVVRLVEHVTEVCAPWRSLSMSVLIMCQPSQWR